MNSNFAKLAKTIRDFQLHPKVVSSLIGLAPLSAFVIIIFQVYSNANVDFIQSSAQVKVLGPLQPETVSSNDLSYRLDFSYENLKNLRSPLLYLPGIKADHVKIEVNGNTVIDSAGNLPYFVSLVPLQNNTVSILARIKSGQKFQGAINQDLLLGETSEIYKTHHRLAQKSFPRHATIIFLLATAAITFAFFLFLDKKQELFALGVALSLLGCAEAIRVGLMPGLSTRHYFVLFCAHIAALTWYAFAMAKRSLPKFVFFLIFLLMLAMYFLSFVFEGSVGANFRYAILQILNYLPLISSAVIVQYLRQERSKEVDGRKFIILAVIALIVYSIYLGVEDFEKIGPFKIHDYNQIPVLFCAMIWMIAAIASLGSLEKRVQIAVIDREKRLQLEQELALAKEVQENFIKIGVQRSDYYDVRTIYKAAKTVGGDWIAWRELGYGYSLGVIGDIVGKGIQAGLVVSACDAALQNFVRQTEANILNLKPEYILKQAVKTIYQAVIENRSHRAMTAVMILAHKDAQLHIVTLGHPPILCFSPAESRVVMTSNRWLANGFDFAKLKIASVETHSDEVLVAYTDGVCDGSKQLKQFKRKLELLSGKPLEEYENFFADLIPEHDDQSVFLIRYRGNRRTLQRPA